MRMWMTYFPFERGNRIYGLKYSVVNYWICHITQNISGTCAHRRSVSAALAKSFFYVYFQSFRYLYQYLINMGYVGTTKFKI